MATTTLSERQVAEVVTSLARGRTVGQTATRARLSPDIVEQLLQLHGPDIATLSKNSKALNKKLRTALEPEELDVDVPISAPRRAIDMDETVVVGPVNITLWTCPTCGSDLVADANTSVDRAGILIDEHLATHQVTASEPVAEPEAAEVELASAALQLREIPPTWFRWECDQCEFEVDTSTWPEADLDDARWPASMSIEARVADVQEGFSNLVASHQQTHVVQAHINGQRPAQLGEILADMGGQLAAHHDPSSGGEAPATGATTTAGEVEEPSTAPAPSPAPLGGWLAPGPRTVERLLDEATRTNNPMILNLLEAAKGAIATLTDAMDAWAETAEQRAAIRHELDVLGRRQDELIEQLARLNAGIPGWHPVDGGLLAWPGQPVEVLSQTPTDWKDAAADVASVLPAPEGFEPFVKPKKGPGFADRTALWFQLTTDVRGRIKPWAEQAGVEHASTGRQPKATVEAYLAAHPEDDPR